MLPAVCFIFSRARCDAAVEDMTRSRLTTRAEAAKIRDALKELQVCFPLTASPSNSNCVSLRVLSPPSSHTPCVLIPALRTPGARRCPSRRTRTLPPSAPAPRSRCCAASPPTTPGASRPGSSLSRSSFKRTC